MINYFTKLMNFILHPGTSKLVTFFCLVRYVFCRGFHMGFKIYIIFHMTNSEKQNIQKQNKNRKQYTNEQLFQKNNGS